MVFLLTTYLYMRLWMDGWMAAWVIVISHVNGNEYISLQCRELNDVAEYDHNRAMHI